MADMVKFVLVVALIFVSSGCSSWYVETGPIVEVGGRYAQNEDMPWMIQAGVKVSKRCQIGVIHISSLLAGAPFHRDKIDLYDLTGIHPRCSIGPGR